jgi:hypothetical protein
MLSAHSFSYQLQVMLAAGYAGCMFCWLQVNLGCC